MKKQLLGQTAITPAFLRRLQKDYDRLGLQVAEIEARRATMKTILDAGKTLIPGDAASDEPSPARAPSSSAPKRVNRPKREPGMGSDEGTWTGRIMQIVQPLTEPMSYGALKDALMNSPLADRLRKSDKGFYGALARLHANKDLVRYKGHVMTLETYQRFRTDLAAGLARDLKQPNAAHHSPMGEAIKKLMRARPNGLESGHIIWELQKSPEMAAIIDRNKTHPYNVLARLKEQGFLEKRGKRFFFVNLKEEPSKAEGASHITDEAVVASPNENRKIGDLLG